MSASNPSRTVVSTPTIGSPCATKFPRYTLSQLHPSADLIADCRAEIYARMPQSAHGALNAFVQNVFADDELVRAYLLPANTPLGQPPTMPLDLCERAATRARQCMGFLHLHERELAAVAAFVQPCGYYWCAREQAVGLSLVQVSASHRTYRARITTACRELLMEPLRQLRSTQPELGHTLAHVLDMDLVSEIDTQQVARIQAVLGLVLMQLH